MSAQRPRPFQALDSPIAAAVAFVGLTALLSLPGLGSSSLVRMEGMIAAIAQEMLASGDYLISRLYGEIYTYKPPLLYWLVAGSIELTGSASEWAIRLPMALSGLILGLATLWSVGSIAGSRVGWIAAVASSTGALALQKLRIAEFDAPLAALVGVAVAAACHALAIDDEVSTALLAELRTENHGFKEHREAIVVFLQGLFHFHQQRLVGKLDRST